MGVVVLLLVGIAASTRASSAPSSGAAGASVVVRSGDTLWGIAEHYVPDRDRGWVMREIKRLNDLRGNRIEVGQELVLPAR
jgi:LysM repeat protein